jgi:integrase
VRRQGDEVFRREGRAWSYRCYDAHGVRRTKGGYATKGEARAALDEVLRQVRLGALYRPNLALAELVARFLEQYEAAPSTVAWVEYHLGRATAAFGDVPIGQLDPAALAAWRRKLPEGSRHQTIKVLRQVLGAAVRWGWCERNAAQLVANPKARRGEIHPFESWQEVLVVAVELGRLGAIAILGAGTGLRPEELFGLEWRDVDLDERVVTVRRAFSKGRLTEWGKTDGSRRRVPLRARVVDALTEFGPSRGIVFAAVQGGRINLDNFRRRDWVPANRAAGIEPPRRPYDLRHTYATWSLAAGVNIFALARRMGTSVKMIDETYGHLAPNADAHERDLLDAFDSANGCAVGAWF